MSITRPLVAPTAANLLPQTTPSPRRRRLGWALRWTVVGLVATAALVHGLTLRRWAWEASTPIRFTWDIENCYNWGTAGVRDGVLNVYDRLANRHAKDGQFGLDYPPLRLLMAVQWVGWTQQAFPQAKRWQNTYEFNRPLLMLNLAGQILAATAAFGVVRRLLLYGDGIRNFAALGREPVSSPRGPTAAAMLGLLAALLLWFNPAVIWNAHCWPQWDIWPVTVFLLGLWAALRGWWLTAGVVLGVGCMMKGQMLLGTPILALWPLLAGRWDAAVRVAIGTALGAALVVSPWLARTPEAWWWLTGLAAALILLSVGFHCRQGRRGLWVFLTLAGVALACMLWPWVLEPDRPGRWLAAAMALVLTAGAAALPRPNRGLWLAGGVAAGLFLAGWTMQGSFAWFSIGFGYSLRHHGGLTMGATFNLAAILQHNYKWALHHPVLTLNLPILIKDWPVTLQMLLRILYVAGLALCALGAARHSRRGDRRVLWGLIGIWVLFFALLGQMHERYLLYAAGVSVVMVALGVGPTILHLVLTFFSWVAMAMSMIGSKKEIAPQTWSLIRGLYPGAAWAILMIAGLFLYMALATQKQPVRQTNDS